MDRHALGTDVLTYVLTLPFVALLPVLFPQPEFSWGQTLAAFAYLAVGIALARFVAVRVRKR